MSTIEAYQHLTLGFVHNKENEKAHIANMISIASSLHTLEISFNILSSDNKDYIVNLSGIFKQGVQWPKLKRLRLQGVEGSDVYLKSLLTDHVTSLRFLELADFDLEVYRHDGKRCHGSWVDIILFLHQHLKLESVRLNGILSNRWDEAWCSTNPDERSAHDNFWYRVGNPCLKHKIERFVVEGGTFPLPAPDDIIKAGDWQHIQFDNDGSWEFRLDLLYGANGYPW